MSVFIVVLVCLQVLRIETLNVSETQPERRYDTELPPSANTTAEAAVTTKETTKETMVTTITTETSLVTRETAVVTIPLDTATSAARDGAMATDTTQLLTSDLVTLDTSMGKFVSKIFFVFVFFWRT